MPNWENKIRTINQLTLLNFVKNKLLGTIVELKLSFIHTRDARLL